MNKLVLVTGSSKGIGASTIKLFAKNDYDVIISYKTNEKLAYKLYEEIRNNYNADVYIEKLDITNEKEVANIFKKYNIDILINNASLSMDNDIKYINKNDFMKVLETNIYGTFLMCKEFISVNKSGVIINISSTDAIDTYNPISIDYCASKAAILNITRNLASNYKLFKICAICPNWVNTESIKEMNQEYLKKEMKRIGQKKLLEPSMVASKIYEMVTNDNIKSGSIVRMD